MTATLHRYSAVLAGFLSGLGGLIATPGFEPLGIPAVVGVAFAFAAAVVALGSTALRSAEDPQP